MKSTLLLKAFAATALLGAALSSQATTVNFTFSTGTTNAKFGSGSFSGTDSDNDGDLTLGELSAFSAHFPAFDVAFEDLSDFAPYSIGDNLWKSGRHSFFEWSDGDFTLGARSSVVTTPQQAVPEPDSIALLGLGLAGLALVRRRKA